MTNKGKYIIKYETHIIRNCMDRGCNGIRLLEDLTQSKYTKPLRQEAMNSYENGRVKR